MSAPLAAWALSIAAVWGSIGIVGSFPESLWLDELHSAWSASGPLDEVSTRASLGNQLSPYFWLLWANGQAFGHAEVVWRAPSLCAWLATMALAAWVLARLKCRRGGAVALAALALIACNRDQIFYASEARPYALLSLVNLAAWCALARWAGVWSTDANHLQRRWRAWWLAWCVLNMAAFWLQPTALLAIAAQYVYLLGLVACETLVGRSRLTPTASAVAAWRNVHRLGHGPPSRLGATVLGGVLLTLAMLPALRVLAPVWERRQQWAGFAAGHRLRDVLGLLPFEAFLIPLLLAAGLVTVRLALQRLGQGNDKRGDRLSSQTEAEFWMWFCAWLLPCCLALFLTVSGLAPLMHRRYVFVAAVPLVIWVAHCWTRLTGETVRWCVCAATILLLLYRQDVFDELLSRSVVWPAVVRGEDWRGAVQWINSHDSAERPSVVFCASNLIEGTADALQDEGLREYLSFPLRSIYRLTPPGEVVPLANDPRTWVGSMRAAGIGGEPAADRQVWLIVRSSAAGLDKRLQISGLRAGQRRDFGGVQVVRDVRVAADQARGT